MQIQAIKTRIFEPHEDLISFIKEHVPRLPQRSIIAITSKIVALSQGRIFSGGDREKTRLIKKESQNWIKTKWCYLALKEGYWCPNAGVDASNAHDALIAWPQKLFETATSVRLKLRKLYNVKQLGILFTDSRSTPLRAGINGVSLGYAGFATFKSYAGQRDLFGRKMHFISRVNIPDALASAAVLVMGEGRERQPLAIIKDAPVKFVAKVDPNALKMDPRDDLYRPVYEYIRKKAGRKN